MDNDVASTVVDRGKTESKVESFEKKIVDERNCSSLCDPVEFEKALSLTGYGKFHYELLFASSLSILSVGFQNGLSAYVFSAAQYELNLTSFQLGLLNVFFMIGGSISSFLWGILADSKGRRPVLIASHLSNAILTVLCSVHKSVESLIICRFFNGFLIGAPGSIIYSYLAEFQPEKCRASVICFSGLFFTSSLLFLPMIAWLVLPQQIFDLGEILGFLTLTPWRVFMIIMIIPELIAGLWLIFRLPESPKFLMSKGDLSQTLILLRLMFSKNSGKDPREYPVISLRQNGQKNSAKNGEFQKGSNEDGWKGNRGKITRVVFEIFVQFGKLFRKPFLFLTLLVCTIMFTNMFGVFGLGLWLPEFFIRFERFQTLHPNSTVTIKQLAMLANLDDDINSNLATAMPTLQNNSYYSDSMPTLQNSSYYGNSMSTFLENNSYYNSDSTTAVIPTLNDIFTNFTEQYNDENVTMTSMKLSGNRTSQRYMDSSVIKTTIIIGITSLVGNAISGFLATKISTTTITLGTMFVGGLSAFSIFWLTSSLQNLIVACIFQSTMVVANMTIGSLVVELFPTEICALAISLTMCAGRLGSMVSNMIFGLLIDRHCEIPIFLVAVLSVIGAGLCYFISRVGAAVGRESSTRRGSYDLGNKAKNGSGVTTAGYNNDVTKL